MSDTFYLKLQPSWKEEKGQPLYRALYNEIRRLVLGGQLSAGTKLPASRAMAQELSVSRNTVTQAIEGLQADGFLTSQPGAGVFISDDLPLEPMKAARTGKNAIGESPEISNRAKALEKNYQDRNHLKNAKPFAPGRPALEDFPFDVWARLLSRRWRMSGPQLGMQEDPAGYLPLRQHIARHLEETRAVHCTAEQVLIVSGAQQGLDLVSRVLWEEGDRIVIEDPGFPGVEGVITAAGAVPYSIPVDKDGLNISAANDMEAVKSFLVTPSRNYPVGVTMSLPRRLGLLETARDLGAWVIEDDFDSDFRFDGRPLSSLQGLDNEGRVIYVGTFSRILFPALRLGFVILPHQLLNPFKALKAYIDGHTSIIHQAALADFFEEGYYASHLRRMRKLYSVRRQFLTDEIETRLSEQLEVLESDGGLHICVRFLQGMDDHEVVDELAQQGVLARPLSRFYRLSSDVSGLVLGFAGYEEKEMLKSLGMLEKILKA